MSLRYVQPVLAMSPSTWSSSNERHVCIEIADQTDGSSGLARVSYERLATRCALKSVRTVHAAVQGLERKRLVDVTRSNGRRVNIFRPLWKPLAPNGANSARFQPGISANFARNGANSAGLTAQNLRPDPVLRTEERSGREAPSVPELVRTPGEGEGAASLPGLLGAVPDRIILAGGLEIPGDWHRELLAKAAGAADPERHVAEFYAFFDERVRSRPPRGDSTKKLLFDSWREFHPSEKPRTKIDDVEAYNRQQWGA